MATKKKASKKPVSARSAVEAPKRMGRPPKKPSEKRGVRVMLRLTHDEAAAIEAAAERDGQPVATWIAGAAIRATRMS